jgi:hypothetical protein
VKFWLDGSFTTHKPEPEDVDFVVIAPSHSLTNGTPENDEFAESLNDKNDEPRSLFKCHAQIFFEGLPSGFANDLEADTRRH